MTKNEAENIKGYGTKKTQYISHKNKSGKDSIAGLGGGGWGARWVGQKPTAGCNSCVFANVYVLTSVFPLHFGH
jgi:hypothetical protein